MEDTSRTSPAPTSDAGRWIGRLLIAVILGEGIWGLIVSITNNLILPFMARVMGSDARSPLYLGNGEFNAPALFTSVLELCFAGIAAVVLNSWIQRKPKRPLSKPVRVAPIQVQPIAPLPSPLAVAPVRAAEPVPTSAAAAIPATATVAPAASSATASSASQAPSQLSPPESPPAKAAALPSPAKPKKPKPPREIVYNSVGEPLPFDDDE